MGVRFLKIAVVYLVIGACLGLGMGITQKFTLVPVHAHVLLLGWASLALAGIVYHFYPAAGTTRLAKLHFWLHNLGLPVFMAALAIFLATGNEGVGPVIGIGGTVVVVGLALFAANVLVNVKAAPVQGQWTDVTMSSALADIDAHGVQRPALPWPGVQRVRAAAGVAGVLALALAVFSWWGLRTPAGRHAFDEMAGMIPLAAGIASGILVVIAGALWMLALRSKRGA